jgi:hypothetical protein
VCARARALDDTSLCWSGCARAHTHFIMVRMAIIESLYVSVGARAHTLTLIIIIIERSKRASVGDESVGVGGTVPTDRPVVGVVQSAHCVIFGVC